MAIFRNIRVSVFFVILAFVITVILLMSYFRFTVQRDYLVSYERGCDPYKQSCFVGCEEDEAGECSTDLYYVKVQKYAPDLYSQCGADITDCVNADQCLSTDHKCTMTYCDPKTEGNKCDSLSQSL